MIKNKNIVVTYHGDDWANDVPFKNENTRKSFEYWHEESPKYGVNMFRASFQWFDRKKLKFKKVWAYREKKWIKINKSIKPNLIFDKITSKRNYKLYNIKQKINKKIPIYNPPDFRLLFDNKLSQYLVLKEFMPLTLSANNKQELKNSLKKIKTKKVVIKPHFGCGGFDIAIGDKKKVLRKKHNYPVIVQEFIDGANGLPGQTDKKLADLRIVFTNHKPIYSLSRIAKGNSLFTNFHQGAKAVRVPLGKMSKKTNKIIKQINNKLKIFNNCQYCLDFMFNEKNQPFLIELNTTPGFDLLDIIGDERLKKKNLEAIIDLVK